MINKGKNRLLLGYFSGAGIIRLNISFVFVMFFCELLLFLNKLLYKLLLIKLPYEN